METFSLDEYPLYSALSYTWGNPLGQDSFNAAYSERFKIYINSKNYEVTKNLHDALLQLQLSYAGRYIWIDAICIWQADVEERNSQVGLMDEIYGKAAKVLIWLGDSDAETASVTRLISLLASLSEETIQQVEKQVRDVGISSDKEGLTYEDTGLPSYWAPEWLSLVSFFRRTYFHRVWVLQENALAKEAQVYCGDISFPAQDLWDASIALVRTDLGGDLREMDRNVNAIRVEKGFVGMTASAIYFLQLMCHANSRSMFLDQFSFFHRTRDHSPDAVDLLPILLLVTRGFKATNPRDHIFSLLGIITKVAKIKGLKSLPIYADYTKTTPEVFCQVTKLILESTGWLAFLAFVPDRSMQSISNMPTWVPDFTARAQTPMMWVAESKEVPRFDAGKVFHSAISGFEVDGNQLRLQAQQLDVVSDLGETTSQISDHGVFEDLAKLMLKCPPEYRTGQDRIEVLWRTLISDQTPLDYPAPGNLAQSFSAWVKFSLMKALNSLIMQGEDVGAYIGARISIEFLAQADQTQILSGYQQVINEVTENGDPTVDDGTAAYRLMLQRRMLPYAMVYSKVAAGRRMFRTESGWLGLGPESLEVGDSVWILAAAPTPYALRKAVDGPADAYELVGEAYVHGAMHGEPLGAGEPQWDWIMLQ
ncbi:MAG: hypothetical protein LQ346_001981 [Caloplaca aetnensis]|nr:MAG: hypothetical protein LQ346_001981 [Caloplaca aetnensis]